MFLLFVFAKMFYLQEFFDIRNKIEIIFKIYIFPKDQLASPVDLWNDLSFSHWFKKHLCHSSIIYRYVLVHFWILFYTDEITHFF